MEEEQASLHASRDAAAKTIDDSPPDLSKEGVLGDLHRVQKESEKRGLMATALRSIDLKGRHLGLWGAKAGNKNTHEATYPDDVFMGPSPADLLLPPERR